jgi:hypothetical protein
VYIAKLKDGPKRAMKLSQMILERVLKMVWWRGRNELTWKDFEVEMFLSSQNIDFPFLFAETFGAFFFPLFFNTFSLSLSLFSMLRLFEDLGILMINEEKNTLQKFLFRWNRMEWLSHDYRNGGVVDILAVVAYSGEVRQYYWERLAKKFGWQIIFKKFQNSKQTDNLTKLNTIKSCYMENIWL